MAGGNKKAKAKAKAEESEPCAEDAACSPSASATAARQLQNLKKKPEETSRAAPRLESAAPNTGSQDIPPPPPTTAAETAAEPEEPKEISWSKEQVEDMVRMTAVLVPVKHVITCILLLPAMFMDCRDDCFCMPQLSLFCMCLDIVVFTGHLLLGILEPSYRRDFPSNNFWLVLAFWSAWNFLSHPFLRENVVDLLVVWPQEVHLVLNVAIVIICSSTHMIMPSWRHLACLIIVQFLLSLALSAAEVMSEIIESWVDAATVPVDLVIFNLAILIIGSTVVFGSMTAEKPLKDSKREGLEPSFHSQAMEDDLERRKRTVLAALCDTVLTTNAQFAICASNETADKAFKQPMLHEILTDYLKDQAEKDKFFSVMKKQFPEDDSLSDGPKRLRVTFRDASGKPFEADVVVSDASTDPRTGKVTKLIVGMHIRSDRAQNLLEGMRKRVRAGLEQSQAGTSAASTGAEPPVSSDVADAPQSASSSSGKGTSLGSKEHQRQIQREFSHELLSAFSEVLRPDEGKLPSLPLLPARPRILLQRANCESFRRRSAALGSRRNDRPVDLRRLSLPETVSGLT